VRPILILTAGFGEGHNAAARNLREAVAAASPETPVMVSDVFLEAYGGVNRLAQRGYIGMINHAPKIWEAMFAIIDRTRIVEHHMFLYRRAARILEKRISDLRPAVIVSTYPGCNHLLDAIQRRRLKRSFKTATIVTDSLTINSVWHRAHSDVFLVANAATAEIMKSDGVPGEKILTLGFPVPRVFASQDVRRAVPPADGRWDVLYVINSGRHLAPDIVRRLLGISCIRLTVTVGKDADLGQRIAAVAEKARRTVSIHGWTPEMPRLMAESHLVISKAGGATVQETLAARTPMIITQIVPGQEEGNARLLLGCGAGALAVTPEAIAEAVGNAFREDAAVWRGWHAAVLGLSRPDASDRIAEFILELSESEGGR